MKDVKRVGRMVRQRVERLVVEMAASWVEQSAPMREMRRVEQMVDLRVDL